MKSQGVDIVVLDYFNIQPENVNRQISTEDHAYYPTELLPESEQELLEDKNRDPKHYGRLTLIAINSPLVLMRYSRDGIEVVRRTYDDSVGFEPLSNNFNYVTRIGFLTMHDDLEGILNIAEPMIVPSPTSGCFSITENREVPNSGALLPIAAKVAPTTVSGIFSRWEMNSSANTR